MSVTHDIYVVYGVANMPETVGGAIDFTKRVVFYELTPAGAVDWVSTRKAAGYASPCPRPRRLQGYLNLKTQGTTHLSERSWRLGLRSHGGRSPARKHYRNPVCRAAGDTNVYQFGGIG